MLGIASQMTLLSTQTIKEVVFKGNRTEVNIPCKKIRDKMNRIWVRIVEYPYRI